MEYEIYQEAYRSILRGDKEFTSAGVLYDLPELQTAGTTTQRLTFASRAAQRIADSVMAVRRYEHLKSKK